MPFDTPPQNNQQTEKRMDKEENAEIREGIDFVFEQNPELLEIGTKEQYTRYIYTIFPKSKLKNIFYHGSRDKEIDSFQIKRENQKIGLTLSNANLVGYYFTSDFKYAKSYSRRNRFGLPILTQEKRGKVYPVILDVKDLKLYRGVTKKDVKRFNNEKGETNISDVKYIQAIKKDEATSEDALASVYYKDDKVVFFELVVFKPDQIHILGSKDDIEGFKNFIKIG